jgi:type II secretory pathway component PulK
MSMLRFQGPCRAGVPVAGSGGVSPRGETRGETPREPAGGEACATQGGSVLIIVLWITFGLISLALYFANSMNFELRASDNRVAGQAAEQAIEGAVRYLTYYLATQAANGSNGVVPDLASYPHEAVPVGESHFWLIGRDTNSVTTGPGRLCSGLVDEASRLNLNSQMDSPLVFSNQVIWLPRMTLDLAAGILDWRETNGNGPTATYYAMQQPAYLCKNDPFETVDELRLVYGAEMDILVGEDVNRNGVLDPNENDENQNNMLDPGVLDYLTVYSREPNSGTINLRPVDASQLSGLLQTNFNSSRASEILTSLGLSMGGGGPGGRTTPAPPVSFTNTLQFYARSGMTLNEFAQIATNFTTTTNSVIEGRVNVNTASAAVLACLLGGDASAAQQLVNYRLNNPNNLTSIAWVLEALGQGYPDALQALEAGDYLTTQSYQFTADVAALGPYGRGYRRVKFVFDTSTGTPQIIYRQDLTHLGWALGKEVRQNYVLASNRR